MPTYSCGRQAKLGDIVELIEPFDVQLRYEGNNRIAHTGIRAVVVDTNQSLSFPQDLIQVLFEKNYRAPNGYRLDGYIRANRFKFLAQAEDSIGSSIQAMKQEISHRMMRG